MKKVPTFTQSLRLEKYRRLRADEKSMISQIQRSSERLEIMQAEAREIRRAGVEQDGLTEDDFDALD